MYLQALQTLQKYTNLTMGFYRIRCRSFPEAQILKLTPYTETKDTKGNTRIVIAKLKAKSMLNTPIVSIERFYTKNPFYIHS